MLLQRHKAHDRLHIQAQCTRYKITMLLQSYRDRLKRAKQAVPDRACAPRATRAERRATRAVPKRAVPKQPNGLTARPKHGTVRAPGWPGHD
jgi:hypothetical protein